jgi:hypothetical protein
MGKGIFCDRWLLVAFPIPEAQTKYAALSMRLRQEI